jgi:hypothetical protein
VKAFTVPYAKVKKKKEGKNPKRKQNSKLNNGVKESEDTRNKNEDECDKVWGIRK